MRAGRRRCWRASLHGARARIRGKMGVREDAYEDLLAAVTAIGYPEELASVLADGLRGEKSMRRMASYLRVARPQSMEEIADEMLAIVEQRESWVNKKLSERAQMSINSFYRRDFED